MSKEIKYLIVLASVFVIILLLAVGCFLGIERRHDKEKAELIKNLTDAKQAKYMKDIPEGEQLSAYRSMIIQIVASFAMTYRKDNVQALNPKTELIPWTDFNFKASKLLHMNKFLVPKWQIKESGLNPYAFRTNSALKEKGMSQLSYTGLLEADRVQEFMPYHLRKFFKIDVKSHNDAYDWLTATKAMYILYWWNMRIFEGRKDWAISYYRFGGFILKLWDGGEGTPPTIFILNGDKYLVWEYYADISIYAEAWEMGDIEPGKYVRGKWDDQYDKLCAEEKQFRKMRSEIRRLNRLLLKKSDLETDLEDFYKELEIIVPESLEKMSSILGEAKAQKTMKNLKAVLKKGVNVGRKLIQNEKLSRKEGKAMNIIVIVILSLLILFAVYKILRKLIWSRKK